MVSFIQYKRTLGCRRLTFSFSSSFTITSALTLLFTIIIVNITLWVGRLIVSETYTSFLLV